jgi:sec-independent protein translocase protein TatA
VPNSLFTLALLDGLGGLEMLVIFVLALMLFGGKRLPEVARGLGKSIREFRRAASGVEDEIRRAMDMDQSPKPRPPVRRTQPASTSEDPATGSPAPATPPADSSEAPSKPPPAAPEQTAPPKEG